MVIEVVRSPSEMFREVWKFVMLEGALVVESYRAESRPTLRHKLKVERVWTRFDSRVHAPNLPQVDESEVPLPADVVQEVRDAAIARLQIGFLSQIRGAK